MIRQHLTQSRNENLTYSTIGKDSVHWSFSKARRFKNKSAADCPVMLDLPSTLEKRTTTFGYGKRWQPRNACGNDAPSPDKYSLPTCFDQEKKGPIMVAPKKEQQSQVKSDTPGPGTYELGTTLCKDAPKFSFRPKFIAKVRCCSPPPGTYNPRYQLLERKNFTEISFGVGSRVREVKARPNTPGPGTYDVPSSFTKLCSSTVPRFYTPIKGSKGGSS